MTTITGDKRLPSGDSLVRFGEVQKSYDGETLVIKNLNLDVFRGEFLTLLGPSGSGKTTTLLMLAGFEPVTHGEIILDGRAITNVPPHRRNIGMVFQHYALFPHMTIEENIAYPLKIRRVSTAEMADRVTRALDMVRLGGFRTRRPSQLSGGQQQRVALARALVFEPTLVLMDEPLGALDRQLREQMQLEIKHMHQELGVTVVYVTHDQGEALTMSDRIAVFNDGIIEQLATPSALYEQPGNAFVAQFIGENNQLRGTVREINATTCLVEVTGLGTVEALAVNVHRPGEPTTLSLRPERVRLNPPDGSLANAFEGQIEEIIYQGDHIRTRLNIHGHRDFVVKLPNTAGYSAVGEGDRVRVGWAVEDCRALDA